MTHESKPDQTLFEIIYFASDFRKSKQIIEEF